MKFGQGNIFRSVCQEFCLQVGGGVPGQVPPEPGRYIPAGPGRYTHPQDQVHPQVKAVHPPPKDQAGTRTPPPPGRYTPWDQAGNPPRDQAGSPEQCMLGDMGNKRAVRILLECILVLSSLLSETRACSFFLLNPKSYGYWRICFCDNFASPKYNSFKFKDSEQLI